MALSKKEQKVVEEIAKRYGNVIDLKKFSGRTDRDIAKLRTHPRERRDRWREPQLDRRVGTTAASSTSSAPTIRGR